MEIQVKRRYRAISDAQKRGMQSQRDLGYTIRQIAANFDTSEPSVRIYTKSVVKKSHQKMVKKAQNLINAGITAQRVAVECGKSKRWVKDNTIKKIIEPNPSFKPAFERRSRVLVSGGAVKVGQVGVVKDYIPPRGEVRLAYALIKFKANMEEWILCDWLVKA